MPAAKGNKETAVHKASRKAAKKPTRKTPARKPALRSAPAPLAAASVPKRPKYDPARSRDDWEIAFAASLAAFNSMLAHEVWQKINGIELKVPAIDPQAHLCINFDCPALAVRGEVLEFRLPLGASRLAFPGYNTSYKGAVLTVTAALKAITLEIRWLAADRAEMLLHLDTRNFQAAARLDKMPPRDDVAQKLTAFVANCGGFGKEVIERIVGEGLILKTIKLTKEQVLHADTMKNLIPSRICVDLLANKMQGVNKEAVVARILCSGEYAAGRLDTTFENAENIFAVASNAMFMKGCLIPATMNVLSALKADLPPAYLTQDGDKFGWKEPAPFRLDDYRAIAQRPEIKALKLDEVFTKLADANGTLGNTFTIDLKPSFKIENNRIKVGVQAVMTVDWQFGGLSGTERITVGLDADAALRFDNSGSFTTYSLEPVKILPQLEFKDTSKWYQKLANAALCVVLVAFLAILSPLLAAIVAAIITFIYALLRPLLGEGHKGGTLSSRQDALLATLSGTGTSFQGFKGGTIDKVEAFMALRTTIRAIRSHPTDIKAVLQDINGWLTEWSKDAKPLTMDDISVKDDFSHVPNDRIRSFTAKDLVRISARFQDGSQPKPPTPVPEV